MAVQSGNQVSTRLADLPIAPDIVTENIILESLESNAFVDSEIMIRDPELDEFLDGPLGGHTISPRFIGPLPQDEPNISNDNPADRSTPKKITGIENKAVRQSLNQSWSSMDINMKLLGADPLGVVSRHYGQYWRGTMGRRAFASVIGVVDADIASGAPVLSVDISGEANTADAVFHPDAYLDTLATMGDASSALTAIAVHSTVFNTMRKQQLIEFIPASDTNILIPYYMGLRVIQDDILTPQALTTSDEESETTPKPKFYSILFGRGAIALGIGAAKVPFEISRDAAAGNGGGEEVMHSRLEWVIHPQGFSFGQDSTPTMAELMKADNWTRNFERKRIPLAALVTAG